MIADSSRARQHLVDSSSPELADAAAALHALLMKHFPDAVISIDGKDVGYGSTSGYKGLVFVVTPQRSWINLGFAGGAKLDDPAGLLEGTGKVHRHLKIKSRSEVDSSDLRKLIRAALAAR